MLNTHNSGKKVWAIYHIVRQRAREEEWTEEVFSESEQTQFDLETARITGEENEELGEYDPYADRLDPVDVIEENPRRMG